MRIFDAGLKACVAVALLSSLAGLARAEVIEDMDFTGANWTVSSPTMVGYGSGVAWMEAGGYIYNTTSHAIAAGDVYQVSWQAKNEPGFTPPPIGVQARLYYGSGTTLATDDESALSDTNYTPYSFSFTVPSDASYIGQPLGLAFSVVSPAGAWGTFTGVSVDVSSVPEPNTLALVTAGLLGLVVYAWRKRSH